MNQTKQQSEAISPNEQYTTLIRGFCEMCKLDLKHVLEGGGIDIGGVTLSLLHHAEAYSPLVMMYCDFGPVPKDMEAQIYKQLLEMNLSAYSGQGETFCLSPEGRVIYANNFVLEALTPELLVGHLAAAVGYAKSWREGAFSLKTAKKPARPHFMTTTSK